MAYILYNAAKRGIKDSELYANYEKQMPYAVNMTLYPREAFGGLYAYYKSSLGTFSRMRYFETLVEKNAKFISNFDLNSSLSS